jgi:putative DNA primase/helicase
VAAALKSGGFRARGVLTLQGPQSIGKTAWISALVPDSLLRDSVIKLDHHLDAGNKDSQITAICHWIVEVGELDSSFRKDIARLKGFITSDRDKVRRPYGRTDSAYQRRTVFCATVNDPNFLVDDSGNTRWWTIPVTSINYDHGIDMQQVFAQLAVDFDKGERWWLTEQEEQWLEEQNKDHRRVSVIRELVLGGVDSSIPPDKRKAMTATQVLKELGIERPSNAQAKECASVLRELYGESKRIQGQNKWRVPLRAWSPAQPQNVDDDDQY